MPSTTRSDSAGIGARARSTLEIIPDTRFIVFRGGEHEASPCKLSGVVRLTAPSPMSITKPRIRFEGCRKIGWWYSGGMAAGEVTDKRVFWSEEQKLGG